MRLSGWTKRMCDSPVKTETLKSGPNLYKRALTNTCARASLTLLHVQYGKHSMRITVHTYVITPSLEGRLGA
jgi:hypothetical protein